MNITNLSLRRDRLHDMPDKKDCPFCGGVLVATPQVHFTSSGNAFRRHKCVSCQQEEERIWHKN